MSRIADRFLAVVAVLAVTTAASAQPKTPSSLAEKLRQRVDFTGFDGTVKDAVKMLAERYDLPLVTDRNFYVEVVDDPLHIPKLSSVRLDSLLRMVAQHQHGAFLVYPDHVALVTEYAALYETGLLGPADENAPDGGDLLPPNEMKRFLPLTQKGIINLTFKNKPLASALEEITDATGANVILAPQAGDKAKDPVTARFANTPVHVAVRTLCEMNDLGVIEDGNVLLVTSRERAEARAKLEAEKKKAKREANLNLSVGGLGGGLGIGGFGVDTPNDLAKLKEQHDALKKQVEELQKQLKKEK